MSNITQFFPGGGGATAGRKQNRRIFHGSNGSITINWIVPPDVTEVEVHCWGAGGDGAPVPSPSVSGTGGGGGGYVTHVYPVSFGDKLLITVGASPGGTSSVSVPTQSPISPISATGGSTGNNNFGSPTGTDVAGAAGGTGSYTISPGISTSRTFSASGGSGGSITTPGTIIYTGGGAAGSPFGPGGPGGPATSSNSYGTGGGGIGGSGGAASPSLGFATGGGGSLGAAQGGNGGVGKNGRRRTVPFTPGSTILTKNIEGYDTGDDWFYVDEILGAGGQGGTTVGSIRDGGAGGGGAAGSPALDAGIGGILGGGGGYLSPTYFGEGGLAGGGGCNGQPGIGKGGAGLVILYW